MANTLYDTSVRSRKFLLIIIVVVLIALTIDTFFSFGPEPVVSTENQRFYMAVDRKFDEVPVPQIPSFDYNKNAEFVIESVHGSYPDVAYVYSINEPREKLLSFENALDKINMLGFDENESEDLGNNDFKWIKDNGTRTLTYNRVLQKWTMDTAFYQNEDALKTKTLLKNIDSYSSRASRFVNDMDFDTEGMDDARVDIRYARLGIDGIFLDVSNSDEAEYVFLNIFRKLRLADLKPSSEQPQVENRSLIPPVADGNVYSTDPRRGQVNMIVSDGFTDYATDLYRMDFIDYEYADKGSYLIITPDEAWNKVQNGEGSLVFLQPQNSNYFGDYQNLEITKFSADARRTELAYWEPETYAGFTFPVYVFKGSAQLTDGRIASFMFFVDAIKRV